MRKNYFICYKKTSIPLTRKLNWKNKSTIIFYNNNRFVFFQEGFWHFQYNDIIYQDRTFNADKYFLPLRALDSRIGLLYDGLTYRLFYQNFSAIKWKTKPSPNLRTQRESLPPPLVRKVTTWKFFVFLA